MLRPASTHDAMSTGTRRDVQGDGMASQNAVTAPASSRAGIYPWRSNEMAFSTAPVPTTAEQQRTLQMVAEQWSGATEENDDLQNRLLDGQVRASGHDGRFKRARDLLPADDEPAKRARYNSNVLQSPSPGTYTGFPCGLPTPEEASHHDHDHDHDQPAEAMSETTAVPDPGDVEYRRRRQGFYEQLRIIRTTRDILISEFGESPFPATADHLLHNRDFARQREQYATAVSAAANAEFRALSTAMTAFMDTWRLRGVRYRAGAESGLGYRQGGAAAGYDNGRPYEQQDRAGGGSMPGGFLDESFTDAPAQQGFADGLSPAPLDTGRDVGTASRHSGGRGYSRQDFASGAGGAGGQPGFGDGDIYEQQVFGDGPDHDPGYNTILSGGYLPFTGMGMGMGMGNYAAPSAENVKERQGSSRKRQKNK
ncbi:hypothetical protein LZ554_006465 [Drepanopeziza brunnea f. sp. 'monogermtubi']|nr:hypothetical protein LZ554_006465 [Drepanopeziza brunnea f. sp. 'monogermtubi']